jgi:hypothetical protein
MATVETELIKSKKKCHNLNLPHICLDVIPQKSHEKHGTIRRFQKIERNI